MLRELQPQDYLESVHIWAARHADYSLLAPQARVGTSVVRKGVPTAYTDGWNKVYGEEFFLGLTREERRFLVLHEWMHQVGRHLTMFKDLDKIDSKRANMAMDYAINAKLVEIDNGRKEIVMPECGLHDPKYLNWDIRKIFADLKENPPQGKQSGMDEHDFNAGAGSSEGGEGGEDDQGKDGMPSPAEQERAIHNALEQGKILQKQIKARGEGSAGNGGAFGEMFKPKRDWRKECEDWMSNVCAGSDLSTFRTLNKRYAPYGVYMPSRVSETANKIVVGFDTSGSCFGTSTMSLFASHIEKLVGQIMPSEVIVVYVDSKVTGHQKFTEGQFVVNNMHPTGGGGTHLPVLFDWMASNQHMDADGVIFFTDGDTAFGSPPPVPVLWAMDNRRNVAPYGQTICVQE